MSRDGSISLPKAAARGDFNLCSTCGGYFLSGVCFLMGYLNDSSISNTAGTAASHITCQNALINESQVFIFDTFKTR